jgi:hypothetical protein
VVSNCLASICFKFELILYNFLPPLSIPIIVSLAPDFSMHPFVSYQCHSTHPESSFSQVRNDLLQMLNDDFGLDVFFFYSC